MWDLKTKQNTQQCEMSEFPRGEELCFWSSLPRGARTAAESFTRSNQGLSHTVLAHTMHAAGDGLHIQRVLCLPPRGCWHPRGSDPSPVPAGAEQCPALAPLCPRAVSSTPGAPSLLALQGDGDRAGEAGGQLCSSIAPQAPPGLVGLRGHRQLGLSRLL